MREHKIHMINQLICESKKGKISVRINKTRDIAVV